MGKYLIILLNLIIIEPAYATKNPIYHQIIKNNVNINKQYAMKLSNIIHVVSKKVGVDARILTAIMAQESMYDNKARGCHKGIDQFGLESTTCSDFGILQLNYKTISSHNFDINLINQDIRYSIESGAIILKWFHKVYKSDPNWWTRFNCGTRGTTDRKTCRIYKSLVSRFL